MQFDETYYLGKVNTILKDSNGSYKLLENIQYGSQGCVYKALNRQTGQIIALKLQTQISDYEANVLEYYIQKQNEMQYNVRMLGAFQYQSHKCVLMEYANGGTLYQYINNNPQMSLSEKIEIIKQLAYGVQELHKLNLTHRDIKPENVVIFNESNKRTFKICDIGLVKWKDSEYVDLMATGTGTLPYMAPEMIESSKYDQQVDIWALGVVFYEVLFRKPLFDGDNDLKIQLQINAFTQDRRFFEQEIDCLQITGNYKSMLKEMMITNPKNRININEVINHIEQSRPIIRMVDKAGAPLLQTLPIKTVSQPSKPDPLSPGYQRIDLRPQTISQNPKQLSDLLQLQNQIQDLSSIIEKHEKQAYKYNDELNQLKESINELIKQINNILLISNDVDQLNQAQLRILDEIKGLSQTIQEQNVQSKRHQQELTKLKEQTSFLNDQFNQNTTSAQVNNCDAQQRLDQMEKQLNEQLHENQRIQKYQNSLEERIQLLEQKLDQLENDHTKFNQQVVNDSTNNSYIEFNQQFVESQRQIDQKSDQDWTLFFSKIFGMLIIPSLLAIILLYQDSYWKDKVGYQIIDEQQPRISRVGQLYIQPSCNQNEIWFKEYFFEAHQIIDEEQFKMPKDQETSQNILNTDFVEVNQISIPSVQIDQILQQEVNYNLIPQLRTSIEHNGNEENLNKEQSNHIISPQAPSFYKKASSGVILCVFIIHIVI